MSYNSENPFVYNPHLYSNSSDRVVYEQTHFAFVHKAVNWTAFGLGLLSCSMTIYLILCRTPEYFRQFSRVLLLCVCTDMIYLLCNFGCQTRINNSNGATMVSIEGPFKLLSYSGQCMSIVVQHVVMILAYIILPIQYHYKYALLKNNKSSVLFLISFYIILAIIFGFISGYVANQAYCTYDNPTKIDYATFWEHEVPVPQLVVAPQSYSPARVQSTFFGSAVLLTYLAVLFFAYLAYKQLKLHADRMSAKTLRLQKQFSRVLFVQSIVPLLLIVVPIVLKSVEDALKTNVIHTGEFAILSGAFFPLLNSISTLIFIGPYRHQCIRILLCFPGTRWQQSSTQPQNETTKAVRTAARTQIVPVESI